MVRIISCCNHSLRAKKCMRMSDGKEFSLPRRFSRKKCIEKPVRGFTMRSSCAPYKGCTRMQRRKKTHRRRSLKRRNKKTMKK